MYLSLKNIYTIKPKIEVKTHSSYENIDTSVDKLDIIIKSVDKYWKLLKLPKSVIFKKNDTTLIKVPVETDIKDKDLQTLYKYKKVIKQWL